MKNRGVDMSNIERTDNNVGSIENLKKLFYEDNLTQYGKREFINYYEKRIQELEADLYSANEIISDLTDSIPKQKVKDKIKDLEYNSDLGFEKSLEEIFKIEVLEELLEEA